MQKINPLTGRPGEFEVSGTLPDMSLAENFMPKQVFVKPHPIHEMLLKNVSYQLRNKKPIASVTLSRKKYDTYELWLRKIGVQTEDNAMLPITCMGIEVLRATDSRMADITVNYRGLVAKETRLDFLEENLEALKLDNKKIIDPVFKNIKK